VRKRRLRHVTWLVDADGTLWVKNPVVYALRELADVLSGYCGLSADEVFRLLLGVQSQRLLGGKCLEAYDWEDIIRGFVVSVCGEGDFGRFVELFRRYFEEFIPRTVLLDGVREVLELVKQKGVRVIVVSNALSQYVEPVVKGTGLYGLVDGVITPDKVDKYWVVPIKPFRPIFLQAMRAFPANKYVMIGNSLLFDAVGALRCGVDRVYVFGEKTRLDVQGLLRLARCLDSCLNAELDGSVEAFMRLVVDGRFNDVLFFVKSWSEILRFEGFV